MFRLIQISDIHLSRMKAHFAGNRVPLALAAPGTPPRRKVRPTGTPLVVSCRRTRTGASCVRYSAFGLLRQAALGRRCPLQQIGVAAPQKGGEIASTAKRLLFKSDSGRSAMAPGTSVHAPNRPLCKGVATMVRHEVDVRVLP